MKNTKHHTTLTVDTISSESYYNLCRTAGHTGYTNPRRAFEQLAKQGTPLEIRVTRDACGNIIAFA
tara:strand:+ start:49 stop:246 length:198 start_codon:yes stop_codon:yes gene_type:complete